jgi:ferrochelatase
VDAVVRQYDAVGGRSPYVDEATAFREALAEALRGLGWGGPVELAMRYGHPELGPVLERLRGSGVRSLRVLPMTPFGGADARGRYLATLEGVPFEVLPAPPYGHLPALAQAWSRAVPARLPGEIALLTAHSVPVAAAEPYRGEVEALAAAVGVALGDARPILAWQSRSGPPSQPWLGPDVEAALCDIAATGGRSVVAVPIGFLCDHVEIQYDLGVAAARRAQELGLGFRVVTPPARDRALAAALAAILLAGSPAGGPPA